MIEYDIERLVIEKIKYAFERIGIEDYQISGAWQTNDVVKGAEENKPIVLAVKVLPRSYDTPTIPDAQVVVQTTLVVRSDLDYNGKSYLEVSDILNRIFQRWQNNFADAQADLDIPDKFNFTGFQISGGDCGIDRDNCVWQFQQSAIVYGTVALDSTEW